MTKNKLKKLTKDELVDLVLDNEVDEYLMNLSIRMSVPGLVRDIKFKDVKAAYESYKLDIFEIDLLTKAKYLQTKGVTFDFANEKQIEELYLKKYIEAYLKSV